MKKIFLNSLFIFCIFSTFFILSKFINFHVLRIFLPINTTYSLFSIAKLTLTTNILFSILTKDRKILLRSFILNTILSLSLLILIQTNLPYLVIPFLFLSIFLTEICVSKIKIKNKQKYFEITTILISFYLFLYFTDKPLNNIFFTPLNKIFS